MSRSFSLKSAVFDEYVLLHGVKSVTVSSSFQKTVAGVPFHPGKKAYFSFGSVSLKL